MSNLRIYIVIGTFLPMVGGSEKQALAHGRSLRERGFMTTIITLRHDRNWLPREMIEGVPIIRVAGVLLGGREKLPGPLRKVLYLLALLVMSCTLLRHRRRYDVIHLYHLGLESLPVALVCWLIGKPLIVSVRGADSGKSTNLPSKKSLLAGPLDANVLWLEVDERATHEGDLVMLERMGKPIVRFTCSLLQRVHAVIVIISSRMKDYLAVHDFNLPDIQLIPNGVDITRFHPTAADTSNLAIIAQQDERAHVVVCVSKLRYQKGIDVLLQAWNLVHKQAPEARLIIVGNGPLQNQLEHMAEALGIANNVEFAGLQSDIPAQLHRGSLAVLPSYWEGMPNAVLEAMALGMPCVATRVSGSEDIIQHGVNGLLVEPADYQSLAEALLHLLYNPALARRYGQAARATIEKYYSLERTTDMYVELYQRITGRRPQVGEAAEASEIYHLLS